MLVDQILHRNALRAPQYTALKNQQHTISWQQLDERVSQIAAALQQQTQQPKARIAILMENNLAYIELYFAIARAGLIAVPLNYKLTKSELQLMIAQVDPELIICEEDYLKTAQSLQENQVSPLDHWSYCPIKHQYFDSLNSTVNTNITLKHATNNEQSTFAIFFTSGTTGLPKGAMVSHRNLLANSYNQLLVDKGASATDINLISTPLYHMGAVFMSITYMLLGCTQLVCNKFDPEQWLYNVNKEGANVALLVPTMINSLVNYIQRQPASIAKPRLIFYGGGPMHKSILDTAIEILQCDFMQGYGLTETLEATFLSPEDHLATDDQDKIRRLQSCGKECVGTEVKIVDDNNLPLANGIPGEILIKSDSVISAYWNRPDASAESIRDGWFYTGDIGYLDDQRYLFVVDRKKDIIISGGVNIYSKDIEDTLYQLEGINEVAVIGIDDQQWGELVAAVIVTKKNSNLDISTINKFCQENMARYKKPKQIFFSNELPKNPSGKILKRELRKIYETKITK